MPPNSTTNRTPCAEDPAASPLVTKTSTDLSILKEESEIDHNHGVSVPEADGDAHLANSGPVKQNIIWLNLISISLIHILAMITAVVYFPKAMWLTILWGTFIGGVGGFGVTGGAHRLWTHRSYKARLPLRIILIMCFSTSGQNTMFDWVRDHRVHHKFSETDADPHNVNRGFFFAHVGWLMQRKHPEVRRRGRQVDMSDVLADPVVQFHQKYFIPMKIILCFIIPICVPLLFWGENLSIAIVGIGIIRYVLNLNFTWLVNSAAHMFGNKPYDRRIGPTENSLVTFLAMGEGWHNYHHVFPWDYKAAELGNYGLNITTFWIDVFAKIGWAYDLKKASPRLVETVTNRYGDGSHKYWGHKEIPEEVNSELILLEKQE